MKRLDKFILKSFIGPFAAILLVVVFILMMQFLWLYIDELVGKGLGLKVILEFMMWGGCTVLPLAIPLATLLASMMTLGSMGENFELLAIKSAGISVGRVMMPLMGMSILISIGAFFAGNDLVPKAFNEIYTLRDDIGRTKSEIKIPSGTFYDGIENYVLRVEDQDNRSGMMYGVMVYDHSGGKGNAALTLADSATLKMSPGKDYLIFSMFNGSNYQETNRRQYRDTSLALQRIDFGKQELIIPLNNYAFEKSDSSRFGDQTKSMTINQLKHQRDSLHLKAESLHDKNYIALLDGSPFKLRKQLDTAYSGGATVKFDSRKFKEWKDNAQELNACKSAVEVAERMSNDISNYRYDSYECNFYLRRTDVDFFKKLAQALACFILFFVGAPLGALIRKGGLGASAIVSVLFFGLYWVIDISGTKLANDGAVAPAYGVFISAFILFPIGIFLTWKAIHDSTLFSMDTFKYNWRRFKSRISGFFHKTRIVYMGTPEFATAPLDRLMHNRRVKVVGVVTVADKPSGRGLKLNESAVKKYAVEHGLPVLQPDRLKDPEFLAALAKWKADLFVVVAFRMLPEAVWKMPKLGTFNLHAALLPQYRGAAPINWAVINGERITGVTTFMIDKDIDTGGIILREECNIGPDDNVGVVHDRLMALGTDLVDKTVESIIDGTVELRVQRSFIQGSEVLKPAPKLTRELCHIDWSDTTDNIYNLVRGLSPYPAAFTEILPATGGADAKPLQLKIFAAEKIVEGSFPADAAPGTVISDGKSLLAVRTSDGAIALKDIQLSGKKRMAAGDFLRGFRDPQDYVCTAGSSKSEIAKTRGLDA